MDHGELIALGTQRELTRQVGENDTVTLEIAEGFDVNALSKALGQLSGIQQAQALDHQVTLITQEADDILASVIALANTMGMKIRSVNVHEPNLESVFLHLTGRALRD